MAKFEESRWGETEYAQEYQDHSQHFLPERNTHFEILASFYQHFVQKKRVLDLGCGDGIISERLLLIDPHIQLVAVDGSEEMLSAAKKRLDVYDVENFIKMPFEDIIEGKVNLGTFDFIVSCFAIHHLEKLQRRGLFEKILNMLAPNAYFLNIDIVLPTTEPLENWYYDLWREWIQNHEARENLSESFSHIPDEARVRPENFYDTLESQLEDLQIVGFEEVACHYRHGLFGIYSGRKL